MEKIKINVDYHTYDILNKDAEMFEFYKKDGKNLNKNALLTNILINYHESFIKKQNDLFDFLKSTISKETFLNENKVMNLCYEIAKNINRQELILGKDKFSYTINLKPTEKSTPIIDYIENYLLRGNSLSEYFRNMLISYTKLPQDEREKIIFKEQYEMIENAIALKKKIFVTTKVENLKFEASPYKLASSKEELHYYLLSSVNQKVYTIRLSKILSVKILVDSVDISSEQTEIFEKMIKYGPQYIYNLDETEVKVVLTPKGLEKFKRMYVHRPVPTKIEDNNFYFNCSYNQILQYFVRFGKDAFIEYPAELQTQTLSFFSKAKKSYLIKINNKN